VVEMVGGRSQIASVTAAMLMVAVLLFLTRPLEKVPAAALAAVVIAAVLRLIEIRSLRELWRIRRTEFAIAMATTATAVVVGLLEGIVLGVALSIGDHLVRVARLRRRDRRRGVVSTSAAGTAADASTSSSAGPTDALRYRFDGPLFFANAHRFRDGVRAGLRSQPTAGWVVVDASRIPDADATAAEMLAELEDELAEREIALVFTGLRASVRDVLAMAGVRAVARYGADVLPPDPPGPLTPTSARAA
jgi:SulP family sulfate permease